MQSKDGELLKPIRIRIMSEAYDLADRDDSEGYNSVKVMCSDVLAMIEAAIAAEREACAKVVEADGLARGNEGLVLIKAAGRIRARGEK